MKDKVFGVGVNDAKYVTQPTVDGKVKPCHFYRVWTNMLNRCYSEVYQEKQKSYIGCSVCDEWLVFSNFKRWMESQDWQNKQLDKDILSSGSKIYSPETCAFVDRDTNIFITDSASARGNLPIGVAFNQRTGKYQARCGNPITKKRESLGYFQCEKSAHAAWKARKHAIALDLAKMQSDHRVASALMLRYK